MRTDTWRRVSVVAALSVAAFAFNTTETLPIGLLGLIADDFDVSLSSVGYLVTGYGLTVAVVSVPLAQLTRQVPRRHVLSALLAVFVVATWVSVATSSYGVLLAARVCVALAQALFWAVMMPVAVGLFPPRVKGRVVVVTAVGGSLATVLGVPVCTWLGQRADWQTPFLVLSGMGLLTLVVIAALLPTTPPEEGHAAYAPAPDTRRFALVLATTVLSVTGAFTGFTYVTEFLTREGGFSEQRVGVLLMVFGLAGVAGVLGIGTLADRSPTTTLALPVALQSAALTGMYLFDSVQPAVIGMLALLGLSAAPVFTATQNRVLRVAPGRTEIGLAMNSAAYNVGIAAGALLGGAVLPHTGVRGLFLLGGVLNFAAVAVLAGERLLAPEQDRPEQDRSAPAPASPAGDERAGEELTTRAKGDT
ncbi:MFS transporter [Streptomyces sp. P1-3]|uniref:MFS transporter n=1 Tax=Streptomyces sp. P1-3 TaxID=3421658 RepID=UPI003D363504